MTLAEMHAACVDRIARACNTGRDPQIMLVVPGSPNRRTGNRRRMCPGGPLGVIACSHQHSDVCWFSATEVKRWCEQRMNERPDAAGTPA